MIGATIRNRAGLIETAGTGQGAEDVAEGSAQSGAEIGGKIEAVARDEGDAVQRERKRMRVSVIGRVGNPPFGFTALQAEAIVASNPPEIKCIRSNCCTGLDSAGCGKVFSPPASYFC